MSESLNLYYEMTIKNGDETVKQYPRTEARSLLKQFMDQLFSEFTCKPTYTTDIYGSSTYCNTRGANFTIVSTLVGTGIPVNMVTPSPPQNPYMTSDNIPAPFVATASYTYPLSPGYHYYDPWVVFSSHDVFYTKYTETFWRGSTQVGWLKIDVGSGNEKIATSYRICSRYAGNAPSNWTLQGSNNDSTWNILDTVTGETSWVGNYEYKTFTCDVQTTPYRYFKLNVTSTVSHGEIYLYQFDIYSTPLVDVMPVSITDYTLGAWDSPLAASSTSYAGPITDSSGTQFMITNIFTNNTASSTPVREIGLYCSQTHDLGFNPWTQTTYHMIARDVITPEVIITPTETLTLTYILATTI